MKAETDPATGMQADAAALLYHRKNLWHSSAPRWGEDPGKAVHVNHPIQLVQGHYPWRWVGRRVGCPTKTRIRSTSTSFKAEVAISWRMRIGTSGFNILVEALQEEGASFRAACARVAPCVYLSAEGVTSICQKERRRGG